MMNKMTHVLTGFCLGLILLPQAVNSEVTASPNAITNDDQAAEEKARNYFTDTEVIDQNGNKLRFYSDVLKDRVLLINFIFTNCGDYCPMVTQKLIQTRSQMAESVKDDIWFISISVDPERDTPEAMKAFAKKHGVDESRWIFLTGQTQNLDFIVKRLGQYSKDVESHSTLMLGANTRTRHWTRVMPMATPPDIARQMRELAEESKG